MKDVPEYHQQLLARVPGWCDNSIGLTSVEDGLQLALLKPESDRFYLADEVGLMWAHMPYWAFAWAAGRALASWVLEYPEYVRGRRVLDLGCGSGIAAIAAARAGASEVLVADLDPMALLAAAENARLNGVCISPVMLAEARDVDLLIASDLLYDPGSHGLLMELFEHIPEGLFAEPDVALGSSNAGRMLATIQTLDTRRRSTLPTLDDFDDELLVRILHHRRQS